MKEELANLRKQQEEISVSEMYRRKQDEVEHESNMESSHRAKSFKYGIKIVPKYLFSVAVQADPLPKNFKHINHEYHMVTDP